MDEMDLMSAVNEDRLDDVRRILKEHPDKIHYRNRMTTPLHVAVRNGNVQIVAALCDANVDVDAVDFKQATPLIIAVCHFKHEIVEMLCSAGADVKQTVGRFTMLNALLTRVKEMNDISKLPSAYQIAKCLVKYGASTNETEISNYVEPYSMLWVYLMDVFAL